MWGGTHLVAVSEGSGSHEMTHVTCSKCKLQLGKARGVGFAIDLLSVPLTIPLVCCHINHFQRAACCGEAMARRRKEEKWARLASRGMCSDRVVAPPVCRHRGVPAPGGVPARCHASGAAVDVCSDAPAWVQRAERAANGGVVDVSHAFSRSPSAPRINAQRVARSDPYNVRNCLPPKKLRREIQ
jgi:hypothetical protein